jgi:hypothetical protein
MTDRNTAYFMGYYGGYNVAFWRDGSPIVDRSGNISGTQRIVSLFGG